MISAALTVVILTALGQCASSVAFENVTIANASSPAVSSSPPKPSSQVEQLEANEARNQLTAEYSPSNVHRATSSMDALLARINQDEMERLRLVGPSLPDKMDLSALMGSIKLPGKRRLDEEEAENKQQAASDTEAESSMKQSRPNLARFGDQEKQALLERMLLAQDHEQNEGLRSSSSRNQANRRLLAQLQDSAQPDEELDLNGNGNMNYQQALNRRSMTLDERSQLKVGRRRKNDHTNHGQSGTRQQQQRQQQQQQQQLMSARSSPHKQRAQQDRQESRKRVTKPIVDGFGGRTENGGSSAANSEDDIFNDDDGETGNDVDRRADFATAAGIGSDDDEAETAEGENEDRLAARRKGNRNQRQYQQMGASRKNSRRAQVTPANHHHISSVLSSNRPDKQLDKESADDLFNDGSADSGEGDSSVDEDDNEPANTRQIHARAQAKNDERSDGINDLASMLGSQPRSLEDAPSGERAAGSDNQAATSDDSPAPVDAHDEQDLQAAAGHHHKKSHGHYYQYVEVPKPKAWKFGFKRGNHKHTIERHEKGYKHKFHSSFKWNAKEKCKKKSKCKSVGKMTWDYKHHKKHHG